MYMIFSFSGQNAETSSQLSYKVSCFIVKTADQVLDAGLEDWQIEEYARRYHHVTRKIAHMGEDSSDASCRTDLRRLRLRG